LPDNYFCDRILFRIRQNFDKNEHNNEMIRFPTEYAAQFLSIQCHHFDKGHLLRAPKWTL